MANHTIDLTRFDYCLIYPKGEEGATLYGFDTYPPGSVLAGQTRKNFLHSFDRLDKAQELYPELELGSSWMEPQVSLNHLPHGGN